MSKCCTFHQKKFLVCLWKHSLAINLFLILILITSPVDSQSSVTFTDCFWITAAFSTTRAAAVSSIHQRHDASGVSQSWWSFATQRRVNLSFLVNRNHCVLTLHEVYSREKLATLGVNTAQHIDNLDTSVYLHCRVFLCRIWGGR